MTERRFHPDLQDLTWSRKVEKVSWCDKNKMLRPDQKTVLTVLLNKCYLTSILFFFNVKLIDFKNVSFSRIVLNYSNLNLNFKMMKQNVTRNHTFSKNLTKITIVIKFVKVPMVIFERSIVFFFVVCLLRLLQNTFP